MPDLATNVLYSGDDLDILRRYLSETCVDLGYLDPPFNSNRDDNVILSGELLSFPGDPATPTLRE